MLHFLFIIREHNCCYEAVSSLFTSVLLLISVKNSQAKKRLFCQVGLLFCQEYFSLLAESYKTWFRADSGSHEEASSYLKYRGTKKNKFLICAFLERLVLYLMDRRRWIDGFTRKATASGSEPATLRTPLDSDTRNSSSRSRSHGTDTEVSHGGSLFLIRRQRWHHWFSNGRIPRCHL